MPFDDTKFRVAIVGGGVGGLMTAFALKKQLGFDNFLIFERAPEVGGTWQANSYPGCACDVGIQFYSLSTDLNPYWSQYYASAGEIKAYWNSLMYKYAVHPRVVFNTFVESATWDDDAQIYRLVLRNMLNGDRTEATAEVVISAVGLLSEPKLPNIPGVETFAGKAFHSARWRQDVSLRGKKVGVIGNGCSGAQIVPAIAEEEGIEVVHFMRSGQWYIPRINTIFSERAKWIFANIPFAQRLYRMCLSVLQDRVNLVFHKTLFGLSNQPTLTGTRKAMTKYLKAAAPPKYYDTLLPDFPPGCKRFVVDAGYLKSLHRSNVTLTNERIEAITPEGIRTKDGSTIPLDVVVFATGFDVGHTYLNVIGKHKLSLHDHFEAEGGPAAYWCTTIPNFPNFFTMLGPNSATGHTSAIFTEEVQVNYVVQMLRPLIQRKVRSFEVLGGATEAFNADLQSWISNTIWTSCASWYRSGKDGKNVALFPRPMSFFWWRMMSPRWDDYHAVGSEKWEAARTRRRAARITATVVGLSALAAYSQNEWFRESSKELYTQTAGYVTRLITQ